MRYSNAKMTGAVPQAASGMATAGSKAALAGAVSDIILGVNECQIAPGETARFPFVACTAYGIPSIHEFNVISDNPNFIRRGSALARRLATATARATSSRSAPVTSGALSMALIQSVYRGEQPGRTVMLEAGARSS